MTDLTSISLPISLGRKVLAGDDDDTAADAGDYVVICSWLLRMTYPYNGDLESEGWQPQPTAVALVPYPGLMMPSTHAAPAMAPGGAGPGGGGVQLYQHQQQVSAISNYTGSSVSPGPSISTPTNTWPRLPSDLARTPSSPSSHNPNLRAI